MALLVPLGRGLRLLGLLALLGATAPAGAAAADTVAGIRSIQDLMVWLDARLIAARTRADKLEADAAAQLAFEQLAQSRLARVIERHAAALAAGTRLEASLQAARTARQTRDELVETLAPAVTKGVVALATVSRAPVAASRRDAHLRALVGGMLAPYAENLAQARVEAEAEQDLQTRKTAQEAALEHVGREMRQLDERVRTFRSARLAALREREAVAARHHALEGQLAALVERERLAVDMPGLQIGSTAALGVGDARATLLEHIALAPAPELRLTARAELRPQAWGLPIVKLASKSRDRPPLLARGFYAPVVGHLRSAAGEDATLYQHGRLLETTVAQTVSAPCSGTVVFAAPFKRFGPLLIIDRGDGYHALLAGFTRLDVARGERVVAGQALGLIGTAHGSAQLYIELRRHGSPLDPAAWLALPEHRIRS